MATVVAPAPLSVTAEAGPAKTADGAKPAEGGKPAPSGSGGITFHEVLSSLNPLQYVPVVGTLYRAVTGDTIPETNRMAGSFVFSGLTGGPVGLATNALTTLLEKVTGFDPDRIGRSVLASLGIGRTAPESAPVEVAGPAPPSAAASPAVAAAPQPSSRDLLAAYGLRSQGAARPVDADALNGMELSRIAATNGTAVAAAYAGRRPAA